LLKIKDIAKLGNVSTTTVSRVLNNNYKNNMRPETYRRILKIIENLEYRPHALASGLRKGIAKVIGIIIPDNTSPYFASICKAIENKCFLQGYGTFFCNSNLDRERGIYYLKFLNSQKTSGLILCNYGLTKKDVKKIINSDTNLVMIDEKILGIDDVDFIGVDDFKGGYLAAEYLYNLGHRNILLLKGPNNFLSSIIRVKGFLNYMEGKGIKICKENLVQCSMPTFDCGYKTIANILNKNLKFSAIFCFNDMIAIGVIKFLSEKKLINDISVIGFDNIFITELITPSLTTIEVDTEKLGSLAVDIILKRLNEKNRKPESIILKPKLIIRESCRKL
jgi:LacI family transcriptional regulator